MTNEQRLDNLYWLEASQDEILMEGANLQVRREFIKYRKYLKMTCKEVKKAYRRGDYSLAKKKIEETKKIIDDMYKQISRIQITSGVGSWIFGWIASDVMFIGRNIISGILGPLGATVMYVAKLIKRVNVIVDDVKKEGRHPHATDFNLYINGIKVRLDEYKKVLDDFAVLIENNEKAAKASKGKTK